MAAHTTPVALAHQAGDALAAGHHTSVEQFGANAGYAVGLVASDTYLADALKQSVAAHSAGTWRALAPAVITTARDLEVLNKERARLEAQLCYKLTKFLGKRARK